MTSIHVIVEDSDGNRYTLDDYRIDFGDVEMGDLSQRRKVTIHNTSRSATDVNVKCVAHPTGQVGSPADTYEAAKLAFDQEGPFISNEIYIGTMSPNQTRDIWIYWPIQLDSLPGWGVFALEVTGVINL